METLSIGAPEAATPVKPAPDEAPHAQRSIRAREPPPSTPTTPSHAATEGTVPSVMDAAARVGSAHPQWSPMLGAASTGKKAKGAGAFSAQRSATLGASEPGVSKLNRAPRESDAVAAVPRPVSPMKIRAHGVVEDVHSLQRHLWSTFPEYALTELSTAGSALIGGVKGSADREDAATAMAELQALQKEAKQALEDAAADVKCEGVLAAAAIAWKEDTASRERVRKAKPKEPSREVRERLERLKTLQARAAKVVG